MTEFARPNGLDHDGPESAPSVEAPMAEAKADVAEYQLIGPSDSGGVGDLLSGLGRRDARIRLQALITEWLRMENLVVLTGAGTSVSSGGKTMANLELAVLDTISATNSFPEGISKQRIVDFVANRINAKSQAAFEEWLSFLVNARYLGTSETSPFNGFSWKENLSLSPSELDWLVDRIGSAILAECALTLQDTSDDDTLAPHIAFLAKLVVRDSNLGRSHVFTLNYDTLFEQALELLGVHYFDGFSGRANARFDPSVYGLDVYYPGDVAEGRVRRFDKFVHFYKLHGSIHWQVADDEIRAHHPDLRQFSGYLELTPEEKAARLDQLGATLPSVGILPTANKFTQTLDMPFAHLFRSFHLRLSAPQTFLLVLGYGFGDDHVTRIIETGLMNPSLIMLVVEPDPTSGTIERISRYKELGRRTFVLTATPEAFEQAKFTHATFDDFARSVMPDVQWLEDYLHLRRFEKQITTASGLPSRGEEA